MSASGSGDVVTLDPQNPWLGLFSYTEETRAYFHGRDEETAELARRVQRKNLTVLFGQSGLGKTSLLRAGLVPRLRPEGFCPVYVRIDYAPESPPPAEQIKQAIFRATADAGVWTRPGASVQGESLWEFLHHRGDLLRDAEDKPLIPLLIFDQFEEVFTLGQSDDLGRERAARFLEDLADLVENRPPAALEKRLDEDDSIAENFDFARADYRILIALREDYLAHLEGVKGIMPSITQNRMRLARMTGAQALSAVVQPGGRLVSQEVAESIVRFVAGGSELVNAEIEPSLLSLVCRELNTARIAQGRKEISADLLAGSRNTILSEFYERALADQPTGVRRVVEDELLTDSGYRESLAEERVRKALDDAGASPDALATLVNRRLLRIEERLDVRRVELTHDVLCSVVLASRNLRHEREARDAAQRQLAEQQAREVAAHRALVRARAVATVCAVLMLFAIAGAIFGWVNLHRARTAEAEAQKSRSDAEKLVSFLIEDFYNELEPTGRLETLGKLARMTVGYYDSLPPELVTAQTKINRAMALAREGAALQSSGKIDAAYKSFGEAQSAFETLRRSGDHSEAVIYGLALTLESQGSSTVGTAGGGRGTAAQLKQAADLLRPLVYKQGTSREVKQLYADTLNYYSHSLPMEQAVKVCDESRKVLAGIGALDLTDLNAASSYADTADSEARHLINLGRIDEAQKLEKEVYDLAEKLLVQRPGDLHALADRFFAAELLTSLARIKHDYAAADSYAHQAAQAGEDEVRFNPSDLGSWSNWISGLNKIADFQENQGELSKAIATRRAALALADDKRRPSSLGPNLWPTRIGLAFLQQNTGDAAGAAQSIRALKKDLEVAAANVATGDPRRRLFAEIPKGVSAGLKLVQGDAKGALAAETAVISQLDSIRTPEGTSGHAFKTNFLNAALGTATRASLMLGDFEQAESLASRLQSLPIPPINEDDPKVRNSRNTVLLAQALCGQGKQVKARDMLQPVLVYYREQLKAGASDTTFRQDFAYALYVDALASQGDINAASRRKTDLAEAARQIAGASAEARNTMTMRQLSGWIAKAQGSR